MIGHTISHYKVLEKIGQGGMGEVYRAEDTTLKREVAIKVLPEQFTKDPQRLARFEREAQLLAQLNHPNIAAIHSFEHADDVHFLVLELVEGETLAERVARGPVPVEEALEVCRQIAQGIEAAHEKGVIHRDLKPANVKLTPEGTIKILDFGLAKAFEAEIPAADISHSPTLTEEMTRAGAILGTAAYMSPEQARGKPVDKRADVWAFGVVLYELLTGKRAFGGENVTDTLAKVLEGEPKWDALPGVLPSTIRFLISRCLQKDPGKRLQHIDGARILIEEALTGETTASAIGLGGTVQPTRRLWAMAVGLVVLTAIVAGLAVWLLVQPSSPEQSQDRFVIRPSPPVVLASTNSKEVAISPDGRQLVYIGFGEGGSQLYLRSLDDFADRPIPGTANPFGTVFFSHDGESIGFFAEGKLKRTSLAGGSPITLCDAPPGAQSGDWFEDTIVFTANLESGQGLYRVSANGGEPEMLATVNLEEGEVGYLLPDFLPDGKDLLFTIRSSAGFQTALLSLETGERKVVLENARQARYLSTGHLVYEQSGTGNLMVVPFDLVALEVTGDSVPVVQGVRQSIPSYVDYAISNNGTLVYVPGSGAQHEHSLVWVDREGRETLVTEEKKDYRVPRISPDGKLISASVGDPAANQLWIYDLEAESLSRLTFEEERSGSSAWSPDSKWLIFQSGRDGAQGMVRQPADRSVSQERLTSTPNSRQMPNSWSTDGRFLAFTNQPGPTGTPDIGILALEGDNEPEHIIATSALECCPKFSPDGKWLAYVSDESTQIQVYVRPFPGPEVKWLISEEDEGGGQPVWSPDGRELFYRSGDKTMVVSIQTQDQTLRPGSPRVLFEGQYVSHSSPPGFQYYDISPDGKRFVMLKEANMSEAQGQINVVQNWFEELKRLVPTP